MTHIFICIGFPVVLSFMNISINDWAPLHKKANLFDFEVFNYVRCMKTPASMQSGTCEASTNKRQIQIDIGIKIYSIAIALFIRLSLFSFFFVRDIFVNDDLSVKS